MWSTEASRVNDGVNDDGCGSVFVPGLLVDELAELGEDLVLAFRPLLVVELGQRTFLVGAVDLVLFAQTHRLHTTVSTTIAHRSLPLLLLLLAISNEPHRYGTHVPYGITLCYLPPDRGDIPAVNPAEAGTRLSDPRRMQN